jgi:hypothetical protein
MPLPLTTEVHAQNPFRLGHETAYRRWRDAKLARFPASVEAIKVNVKNIEGLAAHEKNAMLDILQKTNVVIYATGATGRSDKNIVSALGEQFGLRHLNSNLLADDDSITSVCVMPEKSGRGYIPYSNRRLLWHTDGYYNLASQQIRAFVLHCVQPALEGGENGLFDPEIAYIRLRDVNPDYIAALMRPDAMTIPANEESGENRAAVSGPVFSVDEQTGALHMRYTARTRSIEWKRDAVTQAAVKQLEEILATDSPYLFRVRLNAGEGLLCNNVLHNRTAFTDNANAGRLLYRARYYDRIADTGFDDNGKG